MRNHSGYIPQYQAPSSSLKMSSLKLKASEERLSYANMMMYNSAATPKSLNPTTSHLLYSPFKIQSSTSTKQT